MKTKLLIFCFLLCFSLTTGSVFAAVFSSPHGYRLTLPAGWHVQSASLPGDDADIAANQQVTLGHKKITPFLQVQFRPVNYPVNSTSLAEINQAALFTVRQRFPDLKVVSQTHSKLDGVRDIDCIFTMTANGVPVQCHEVLVVKNKKAFTFTGFCPSQVYPRYAAAYAQMLSSVRWNS